MTSPEIRETAELASEVNRISQTIIGVMGLKEDESDYTSLEIEETIIVARSDMEENPLIVTLIINNPLGTRFLSVMGGFPFLTVFVVAQDGRTEEIVDHREKLQISAGMIDDLLIATKNNPQPQS